jgi:hypothetical protein
MSQNLVQVKNDQTAYLESIGCSFRFSIETRNNDTKRVCELIDMATEQAWNKTLGDEWQETFDRCLETSKSRSSLKPKTAAEIAQDAVAMAEENAKLREKLAAAEATASLSPKRQKSADAT